MMITQFPTQHRARKSAPAIPQAHRAAFVLVTGLFFLWGIPNNLNDVLIRQFMKSFEISRFQAGLIQSAFYIGYFVVSIPAAMFMRRYGYKAGLLAGIGLYASGTFAFLPAAHAQSYAMFLLALFVIASGLGFLETGSNPLIAQFGAPESSVRRLNFSQAFNPLGSITGVLIGTVFIFSGTELTSAQVAQLKAHGSYVAYLQGETLRVVAPYLVLGVLVVLWGLLLWRTPFPAVGDRAQENCGGSYLALLHYPHFLFAVVAQFCYVGAQVGTWSYFIQYVEDYTRFSERGAGYLLTATLAGFALGRFTSSQLMQRVSPARLMGFFALTNVLLVSVAVLKPGPVGTIAIFLTSFFMSLMFPTIFALGIRGLEGSTKQGSSLIIMSIIGGAIFTPIMGVVYQNAHSMAEAMVVPLGCYLIVALFSFWGCALRSQKANDKLPPEVQNGQY